MGSTRGRRGREGGLPSALKPGDLAAGRALMKEGILPVRDVARRLSVSVATLYRHVGKRGPSEAVPDSHG